MEIVNTKLNVSVPLVNSKSVGNTNSSGNISIYSDDKVIEMLQSSAQVSIPKTPKEFQKTLGLSGSKILTGSTIDKKDGSSTDIYQFENGSGELRVKTSKDKKTQSFSYYKYDFSKDTPIGIFNIKEITLEDGKKAYRTDFIDNLSGFCSN